MNPTQSLFAKAQTYIPGGVNSPVRAFKGVGGDPVFFAAAHGAYLVDTNGREYVDYIGSWGPMIAGHAHPRIVKAVMACVQQGLSFGAPTELEVQLAEKICQIMPAIEQVRMVNSGTEATMSALRLARGFTGRDKIIKFEGCYHGHADSLLVAAGSGALTLGVPTSAGVPESIAKHTLVADYNDLASVEKLLLMHGKEVAAIIVEPVAGNMNLVLPEPDFLPGLRKLCDQYGSLLILDEVMTGFRVALGGACDHYGIKPDLITLGKIIGGGMPVGAFGGRKDIMEHLAPLGPVYQAGTLSGNPVAMTAGLATLAIITEDPEFHSKLTASMTTLLNGLQARADAADIPFLTQAAGGMFGLYFTTLKHIRTFADVKASNIERFKTFFHLMLKEGVYLAPSAYEAGFLSSAHTDVEINKTLVAAERAFATLAA